MPEAVENTEVYFENSGLFTVKMHESPENDDGASNIIVEIIHNENGTYIVFDLDDYYEMVAPFGRVISFAASRYEAEDLPKPPNMLF